ncbi:hypothetical protein PQD69_gp084 [Carnobacterium phage cd4]|uniref:Uncharacterized protein n=1 Tax=Carnobacterium phage cd4 TaxID=2849246 RepID=A0AAE7SVE9_9CAUD|nr:hypothetical protein PQD69_gp084 [Carnobacterium phage cd4]QXP45426.1 hypothetical protein cd4_084 [Carnobacterium phage cd4]
MKMMKIEEQENLRIAVSNVILYKDFAEYEKYENVNGAEFIELEENGFIGNLTLGTYNGATDSFQKRTIDDSHILEAILTDIHECELYELLDGREVGDEQREMSQADYIREYTEIYKVFSINNELFVDKD